MLMRTRESNCFRYYKRLGAFAKLATSSRFAKGLSEDYEAVKAGVTLPWSTGPVEGHINRLKMLKRQMFRRARLNLLSRRVVGAPRDGPAQTACPRAPAQAHAEAA